MEKGSLKLEEKSFSLLYVEMLIPAATGKRCFGHQPAASSAFLDLKERHSKLHFMFYSDMTCKLLNCFSIGVPTNSLQFLATDADYPLLFLLFIVNETCASWVDADSQFHHPSERTKQSIKEFICAVKTIFKSKLNLRPNKYGQEW
jgi:hypothetical protein